jgi:hypothetical protein
MKILKLIELLCKFYKKIKKKMKAYSGNNQLKIYF